VAARVEHADEGDVGRPEPLRPELAERRQRLPAVPVHGVPVDHGVPRDDVPVAGAEVPEHGDGVLQAPALVVHVDERRADPGVEPDTAAAAVGHERVEPPPGLRRAQLRHRGERQHHRHLVGLHSRPQHPPEQPQRLAGPPVLRVPVHHGVPADEVLAGQPVEQAARVVEQAHLGVAGQHRRHGHHVRVRLHPVEQHARRRGVPGARVHAQQRGGHVRFAGERQLHGVPVQRAPDREAAARGEGGREGVRGGEKAVGQQHLREQRQRRVVEAPRGVRVDGGGVEDGGRVGRAAEQRHGEVQPAGRGVRALETEVHGFVLVHAGAHRRGVELGGAARGRAARQ